MKYYKLFGAATAVGLLLFAGFGCGGGDSISDDEEEYVRGQVAPLEEDIASLREDIARLGEEVAELRMGVKELTSQVAGLAPQEEIASLREEIGRLREEIASLREEIILLKVEVESPAVEVESPAEVKPVSMLNELPGEAMPLAVSTEVYAVTEALNGLQAELTVTARMLPSLQVEETSALDRLRLIRAISEGDLTAYMLYSIKV